MSGTDPSGSPAVAVLGDVLVLRYSQAGVAELKIRLLYLVYSLICSVDYWSDEAANTQVADDLCNYITTGCDGIKKKNG